MWLNLSAIFQRLSHDPSIRSVLLTGAGDRAFTAGLDVQVSPQSHPTHHTLPSSLNHQTTPTSHT
jgi:delta(3,5)-delta(2,4)-dienoyl-CoA isomerase